MVNLRKPHMFARNLAAVRRAKERGQGMPKPEITVAAVTTEVQRAVAPLLKEPKPRKI